MSNFINDFPSGGLTPEQEEMLNRIDAIDAYSDTKTYQVGEFAVDNPQTGSNSNHLNLKLLKHSTIKTNLPAWNLTMKNIYSLNTYNLQKEDFVTFTSMLLKA